MPPDLLSLFAARRGHFRYESGHHGDLWLDLDGLFRHPDRLRPFADDLAHRLAAHRPAVVCGPLVGGAFLGQTVATILDVEFAFAERVVSGTAVEYRVPPGLRPALRGRAVAVVDDAINAGSAVRGTVAALEGCGAHVVAVGALVVLGTAGPSHFGARGIPTESLAAMPNDLWEPACCPLCAAGVPVEDLGTA